MSDNQSVQRMITAIMRQMSDRLDHGDIHLERELSTLHHQLKSAQQLEAPHLEADIHLLMGRMITTIEGATERAFQHIQQAEDLFNTLGRTILKAAALIYKGRWYCQHQDFELALATLKQATALAEATGNFRIITQGYADLGTTYNMQEKYTEALAAFKQASELLKEGSITRRRGELMLQIDYGVGLSNLKTGNPDEAWRYGERLYQLAKAYKDVTYEIRGAALMALLTVEAPRDHTGDFATYIMEATARMEATQRYAERGLLDGLRSKYANKLLSTAAD